MRFHLKFMLSLFCGFFPKTAHQKSQEKNYGMRIRGWFACVQEACDAMEFTLQQTWSANTSTTWTHRNLFSFLFLCLNTQIIWKSCDDQMKKITTRNLTTVLFCGPFNVFMPFILFLHLTAGQKLYQNVMVAFRIFLGAHKSLDVKAHVRFPLNFQKIDTPSIFKSPKSGVQGKHLEA